MTAVSRMLFPVVFAIVFLISLDAQGARGGSSAGAPVSPSSIASAQQAKKAAEEKKKMVGELKVKARRMQQQERNVLAEIERRDRELASRRSELRRYQGQIAETEAQIKAHRRMRELTQEQIQRSLEFLGRCLKMWYQEESGGQNGESALICASPEADRVSAARVSRIELQQREEELSRHLGSLTRLKQELATKERELAGKRKERASFLARLRLEKRQTESFIAELNTAAARLDRLAGDLARKAARRSTATPVSSYIGQLQRPVRGSLLRRYGKQKHEEFNASVYSSGIVIGARAGTKVAAAASGEVVYADWLTGYGRLIIIDHGGGLHTVYGHLEDVLVGVGTKVRTGMAVGTVGDTGSLGKPSLYFEVRFRGRAVDPVKYLPKE